MKRNGRLTPTLDAKERLALSLPRRVEPPGGDPFEGFADAPPSLHKYLYAHANPTAYADPLGLCVFGLRCPELLRKTKESLEDAAIAAWSWLTSPAERAAEDARKAFQEGRAALAELDAALATERYSAADLEEYFERYPRATASAPGLERLAQVGQRLEAASEQAGRAASDTYTTLERAQFAAGTAAVVFEGGKFLVRQVVGRRAAQAAATALRVEAATLSESTSGGVAVGEVRVLRSALPAVSKAEASVATEANQAVFWSGRTNKVGGAAIARQIAAKRGGVTLEALVEQRGLSIPAWDPADPASLRAWQELSQQYAAGASGEVRAIIGQSLRPGNLWESIELPALKANPRVTKIVTVDPATSAERIIFQR